MSDERLVPKVKTVFDESEKGTVFRVDPEPGTEVEAGTPVTLFVSGGFPELAYDNDKDILLVNAATSKPLDPIAKGPQDEHDPAWSADGSAIAYTSDGQVFLSNREKPDESPLELTKKGETFSDLAWAPTAKANVLAMAKKADGKSDLCLGKVDADGMTTRLQGRAGHQHRAQDQLGARRQVDPRLGLQGRHDRVRHGRSGRRRSRSPATPTTTRRARSSPTSPSRARACSTPPSRPTASAWRSPSSAPNGRAELFMAKRGDFLLAEAKALRVRACKVIWRPDGQELVVVQADDCIGAATGELVRLSAADPTDQQQLKLGGDNPAYQPLSVE